MVYAQFDDAFTDHPKVAGLTDAAFRLHVAGILYCARMLTDGLVDADDVPRLVRRFRRTALNELCDRGIWRSISDGTAYEIHDYLQWNPTRDRVLDARAKAAKRKAAWYAKRAEQS